jgi:hypothetical protein
MKTPSSRFVRSAGLAFLAAAITIQFVPYGREHVNPTVTLEPRWDSPRTRELATRACFACHSNETQWPWYSNVAPLSWRIQNHVDEGRQKLNFSEFDRPQEEAHEAAEAVHEGEMPPWDYVLAHPEARLSPSEQQDLIRGLQLTLGQEASPSGVTLQGDEDHEREHGRGD